jgi:hypothetical protein
LAGGGRLAQDGQVSLGQQHETPAVLCRHNLADHTYPALQAAQSVHRDTQQIGRLGARVALGGWRAWRLAPVGRG